MLLGQEGLAFVAGDQRAHQPATIRRDVDAILPRVVIDRNELLNAPTFTKGSEVLQKLGSLPVDSDRGTIHEDEDVLLGE